MSTSSSSIWRTTASTICSGSSPALTASRPRARPRSRSTETASPMTSCPPLEAVDREQLRAEFAEVDDRFPDNPPNQPFSIDAYVPLGEKTGDPIHRFYHQQAQIDGGLMDKFVAYTNVGALVMGYYDGSRHKPLGICEALHTSRPFLPSCLRRLVPQPFLVDLRLHAGVSRSNAASSTSSDGPMPTQAT